MKLLNRLVLTCATFLIMPGFGNAQEPVPVQKTTLYDHHVHVLSPTLIAHWKSVGTRFSRDDEQYSDPSLFLSEVDLGGAFLVSMAHLYSMERFRRIDEVKEHEGKLVAMENDFIAKCVASSPGKFVGFFSVNPLSEHAWHEMERCRQVSELTGLKLHLPACGFDANNASHIEKIQAVFTWAESHDVPILLHLFAGGGIDVSEATRFWREIVEPTPDVELYLAHLGAAGGYNDSSRHVLSGFEQLCELNPSFSDSRIFFDLSGAVIGDEGVDEVPPTSPENCQAFSEQMRRIGIHRFLFASDYPVFTPTTTQRLLLEKLSLTDDEFRQLFANKSTRFRSQ